MDTQAKKQGILIVEDEVSMLNALRDKFTREGFTVFEAKNGEEGLATALREHPNLILLDIVMPKMDGLTMLRNLRKNEWGKTVPVIVLTNLSSSDDVAERIEKENVIYLVKADNKMEDIVAKIKKTLGL